MIRSGSPLSVPQFLKDGYAVVEHCLSGAQVARLKEVTDSARGRTDSQSAVSNSSGVYALRNLTDVVPETVQLAFSPEVSALVEPILGPDALRIRATLFDKTEGANWGVFWHQDLSIAVRERHDMEGFHSWTRKAGVQCVQAPLELMAKILTVRLHLDDCYRSNGALRVLPGTHSGQQISADRIGAMTAEQEHVVCEVPAGGAVLMRPLLLHASSPMECPGQRRVIHFEYAAFSLPAPLEWRFQFTLNGGQ